MCWHVLHFTVCVCVCVCDLKAAQMNAKCRLIWEFMLYEFKLNNNTMKASKSIRSVRGKDVIDHNTVTRWSKKFRSGWKKPWWSKSGWHKSEDSKAVLQDMENYWARYFNSFNSHGKDTQRALVKPAMYVLTDDLGVKHGFWVETSLPWIKHATSVWKFLADFKSVGFI